MPCACSPQSRSSLLSLPCTRLLAPQALYTIAFGGGLGPWASTGLAGPGFMISVQRSLGELLSHEVGLWRLLGNVTKLRSATKGNNAGSSSTSLLVIWQQLPLPLQQWCQCAVSVCIVSACTRAAFCRQPSPGSGELISLCSGLVVMTAECNPSPRCQAWVTVNNVSIADH